MTTLKALGRRRLVPILALVTALAVRGDRDRPHGLRRTCRGSAPTRSARSAARPAASLAGYGAMLSGAFGDPGADPGGARDRQRRRISRPAIRPLTETLVAATPLIFAGPAVAISFRAGMFNIGVDGQLMIGALGATLAAFALEGQAPSVVILLVGDRRRRSLFGAFWGFIPGFLKARTGAHEVITTIMLNYVAAQVVFFALRSDDLRRPGSTAPVSKAHVATSSTSRCIINLPRDPPRLRLRRRAADGRSPCRCSCSARRRATSCAPPAST